MHLAACRLRLLLLVALTGYAHAAGATTYTLLRSYRYPATVSLGRSVTAVGGTIVGGAPFQAGTEAGAVYVFDRATGALLRRLAPPQSPVADFGRTSYALCVYDTSGASQPLLGLGAPGGQTCSSAPCWRATNGFSYRDGGLTPSGVSIIRLTPGADGSARITLVGRGANLGLPPLPLIPKVTVQLLNTSTNVCWEASFSTPALNTSTKFIAKSD